MRKLLGSILFVLLIVGGSAQLTAGESVATLRLSSLEAALADAERLSSLAGETRTRDDLFETLLSPVGIEAGEWIDRSLPVAIVLPSDGLMNGGWVGALPARSTEAAMEALEEKLGAPEVDGELRAFVTAMGSTIHVRPVRDYLIFGQVAAAVRRVELEQILDVGDLPPGNIVLDLDLVPLTSMAQFGMAAGRQGVEDSLELDESDTAGREAAMSMYDFYAGVVNDILLNTSRLQLSLEVGSDALRFHEWILPRAESTLDELLKAQKGEFPAVARRLNVDSAVMVMAGNVEITERFRAAVKEFMGDYTATMDTMGRSMPGGEKDWFFAAMGPWMRMSGRWIGCTRGDGAASYEFSAESGLHVAQIAGLNEAEGCGDLLAEANAAIAAVPDLPDGRKFAVIQENALQHAGVRATRIEMDLFPLEADADEDALEFLEKMFGGTGYVSFMGMKDNLLVSTAGARAEEGFKRVVDDLSNKKTRGGMSPKMFEPLKAGNGVFIAVDLERALREIAKLDPEDEDLQQMDAVASEAGRWVFGAHMETDALRITSSIPLTAITAIAKLDEEDDVEEHGDDAEHHDDDPGQHGHESGEEHDRKPGIGDS